MLVIINFSILSGNTCALKAEQPEGVSSLFGLFTVTVYEGLFKGSGLCPKPTRESWDHGVEFGSVRGPFVRSKFL